MDMKLVTFTWGSVEKRWCKKALRSILPSFLLACCLHPLWGHEVQHRDDVWWKTGFHLGSNASWGLMKGFFWVYFWVRTELNLSTFQNTALWKSVRSNTFCLVACLSQQFLLHDDAVFSDTVVGHFKWIPCVYFRMSFGSLAKLGSTYLGPQLRNWDPGLVLAFISKPSASILLRGSWDKLYSSF